MSKSNSEIVKNKILKYKVKYNFLFNNHNNMLQYHNLSDFLRDRIILRQVEETPYTLPIRPIKTNIISDKLVEIVELLRSATIDTNFKNPYKSDSETLTVFEFAAKDQAEKFSKLLSYYDIGLSIDEPKKVEFTGKYYYVLLKPVDMLLLIKLLINRPIKLSEIKTVKTDNGEYLRAASANNYKPYNKPDLTKSIITGLEIKNIIKEDLNNGLTYK
jgi:hypothetical protein